MNSSSSAIILVLPLLTEESATSASTNSASSTGAVEESAEDEDEDDVEVPPKPARDADGKFVAKAKVSGGDARTHTNPMRASGASRRTTDVFMPARMVERLEAAVAAFFVGIVRSSFSRKSSGKIK